MGKLGFYGDGNSNRGGDFMDHLWTMVYFYCRGDWLVDLSLLHQKK